MFFIQLKVSRGKLSLKRVLKFKINNTWLGFHKDIAKLVFILRKNLFAVHLIDKCVHRYYVALRRLVNRYCNDLDIKLLLTTFKLRNLFSVKDSVPRELRSCVVYKFTCACCNACYIGKTSRHFSTCVHEHPSSDKSSHIFKHLLSSERCRQSCSTDCFKILDSAPTKFQLKLKEAMHINWEKPNLNQQVHHVNLTLIL